MYNFVLINKIVKFFLFFFFTIPFLIGLQVNAEISLIDFIRRLEKFNKNVGVEHCDCSLILNSVKKIQEHVNNLPEANRVSAQGYMKRLVFNSPKFAPCFNGEKDLGASCGICPKTKGNSALVVMDMQVRYGDRRGVSNNPVNQAHVNTLINEQVKAIELARKSNLPILIVEYDIGFVLPFGFDESWKLYRIRNKINPQIMSAVEGYNNVQIVKKTTDSFLHSNNKNRQEVVDFFRKNEIQQVIMTGASGGACIDKSIEDLVYKNCEVVAYSPGIIDFNHDIFKYPYTGFFEKFKIAERDGHCQSCKFQEIHSLKALESLLQSPRSKPRSTTSEINRSTQ